MNIKTRLTRCCGKPVGGYKCGDGIRCPDCFDKLQGWREIERLRGVLKEIAEDEDDYYHKGQEYKEIARAALKGND